MRKCWTRREKGARARPQGCARARAGERIVILTHRRRCAEGIICSVCHVG